MSESASEPIQPAMEEMRNENVLGAAGLRQRLPSERTAQRRGDADVAAGGTKRHLSLSEPGLLPSLCMQVPGVCLLSLLALLPIAAWISSAHFFLLTAAFGFYVAVWTINMSCSSAFGAYKMRSASTENWTGKVTQLVEQSPDDNEFMHIVLLPNYKEDEDMLLQTVENLGRCSMARSKLHVVLAMELREGAEVRQKAERLIRKTSHLFAEIVASFHPPGLPNEVPGKSSNAQWGFKEALRAFAPKLSKVDPSRVFLSVGDADVLWHPEYFSALAYQGLCMPEDERAWSMWQPPVLLTRNLFSVPGPVRVSGLASLLFELSGLSHSCFGTHCTFSTYSMTMAMACHPEVDGWDVDVIAEDHHMFCKCYFAYLWESASDFLDKRGASSQEHTSLEPKFQLHPVWLPAVCFMAESARGYVASLHERFVQAQRHSYGVVELGYVMLQYIQLMLAVGPTQLPRKTHTGILSIVWKMHTVHIMNTVQACSLVITGIVTVPALVSWLINGGLQTIANGELVMQFDVVRWALCAAFGPLPPVAIISACCMFIVVMDIMEGRYTPALSLVGRAEEKNISPQDAQPKPLSWWQKVQLCGKLQSDMMCLAEPTVVIYGMVPEMMAVWKVLRQSRFDYVVAAKPVGEDGSS